MKDAVFIVHWTKFVTKTFLITRCRDTSKTKRVTSSNVQVSEVTSSSGPSASPRATLSPSSSKLPPTSTGSLTSPPALTEGATYQGLNAPTTPKSEPKSNNTLSLDAARNSPTSKFSSTESSSSAASSESSTASPSLVAKPSSSTAPSTPASVGPKSPETTTSSSEAEAPLYDPVFQSYSDLK